MLLPIELIEYILSMVPPTHYSDPVPIVSKQFAKKKSVKVPVVRCRSYDFKHYPVEEYLILEYQPRSYFIEIEVISEGTVILTSNPSDWAYLVDESGKKGLKARVVRGNCDDVLQVGCECVFSGYIPSFNRIFLESNVFPLGQR
jgi:hypothetical protein